MRSSPIGEQHTCIVQRNVWFLKLNRKTKEDKNRNKAAERRFCSLTVGGGKGFYNGFVPFFFLHINIRFFVSEYVDNVDRIVSTIPKRTVKNTPFEPSENRITPVLFARIENSVHAYCFYACAFTYRRGTYYANARTCASVGHKRLNCAHVVHVVSYSRFHGCGQPNGTSRASYVTICRVRLKSEEFKATQSNTT